MEDDKELPKRKSSKKIVKRRGKDPKKQSNKSIPEEEEPKPTMKKKKLEIQVIEHPEANQKVEDPAIGDGSDYVESESPSQVEEPNHRQGTLGPDPLEEAEGEYYYEEEDEEEEGEGEDRNNTREFKDSMEDKGHKESMQSFGNNSGRKKVNTKSEEAKIKQNAKNNSGIQAHHLNEFLNKSKEKDPMNKTTKFSKDHQFSGDDDGEGEYMSDNSAHHEDVEQDGNFEEDIDDPLADDEMILRQQKEAEELLQETKKEVEEDENEISHEEDEAEEFKHTEENKFEEEVEPESEEQEDNEENAGIDTKDNKFSLNYTVGRIEDGAAILISKDHNLIEIPL